VNVAALIADATAVRERLLALGPDRMAEVDVTTVAPRVRLAR